MTSRHLLATGLFAIACLGLALTSGAARAQVGGDNGNTGNTLPGFNMLPGDRPVSEEERQRREEQDRAYRDAIKKIPARAQPATNDPWGGVREPAKSGTSSGTSSAGAPAKKQAGAK